MNSRDIPSSHNNRTSGIGQCMSVKDHVTEFHCLPSGVDELGLLLLLEDSEGLLTSETWDSSEASLEAQG